MSTERRWVGYEWRECGGWGVMDGRRWRSAAGVAAESATNDSAAGVWG